MIQINKLQSLRSTTPNKLFTACKGPTPINLDLRLDDRIARVERKGHLSVKLAYFKKEIQPVEQAPHIKETKEQKRLRETKRTSLQLLPRLHEYQLPIQQIPEKEVLQRRIKPRLKMSPTKRSHSKLRKARIQGDHEFERIDKVLLKMVEQQDLVHRLLEENLQRHLTQEEKIDVRRTNSQKRKSVDPRIETLDKSLYQNPKINRDSFESKVRQRLHSKDCGRRRYQNGLDIFVQKKDGGKQLQYKGWEVPRFNDDFIF